MVVLLRSRTAKQALKLKPIPGGRNCVTWRETFFCHPFGDRYAPGDKPCDEVIIPQISGYCLCDGNITTARVTCGPKRFTCRQKCMELAYNPVDALVQKKHAVKMLEQLSLLGFTACTQFCLSCLQ
eukprot:jgi/Chrzof1/11505/UNPLg00438.t1